MTAALIVLGSHAPSSVWTATPLSDRLVVDRTWPVHGRPVAVTPAHKALPLKLADVIEIAPALVTEPTMFAEQPTAMPDFVNVVEPVKLIEPAGETVTANAEAEAAMYNANAAPTGMSLKLFMSSTSH